MLSAGLGKGLRADVFEDHIIDDRFDAQILFGGARGPAEKEPAAPARFRVGQVGDVVTDKIGLRKPIQIHVLNKIPLRRKFFIKTA